MWRVLMPLDMNVKKMTELNYIILQLIRNVYLIFETKVPFSSSFFSTRQITSFIQSDFIA